MHRKAKYRLKEESLKIMSEKKEDEELLTVEANLVHSI
jgi:hypothetical protein